MGARAVAKRHLPDGAAGRIENAERTLALRGVPDLAVGRRRDIVRAGARGQVVDPGFVGSGAVRRGDRAGQGGKDGDKCGGERTGHDGLLTVRS